MAGQTAGPIKTKLGIGTDVDPGSVLGKVKSRSCGATWRMLIKIVTEVRKGRENSSAKRDKYNGVQTEARRAGRDNRARSAIASKNPDRGP